LGAPIRITAELAPRSLDNSGWSARFAREESFPDAISTIAARAIADALPIVKRAPEPESVQRVYPRRFIYEHLEKRATTVTEEVNFKKVTTHDTPADAIAYNHGKPVKGDGNIVNGFTATIVIPGAAPTPTGNPAPPTATTTSTPSTPSTPSGTTNPPASVSGCPQGPDGTTPANGCTKPDGTTVTPPPAGNASPDANNTTTGGSTTTTTTDGQNGGNTTTGTTTDGQNGGNTTTPPTPDNGTTSGSATPDATTTTTTGDAPATRREVKDGATSQPISRRQLAVSGAAWAASLRRRAL